MTRTPKLINRKWRDLVSSARMSRCLSLALRFFVFFVSFSSVLLLIKGRGPSFSWSSIYLHPGSNTQLPNNCRCPLFFSFFFFGDAAFSEYSVSLPLPLYMESTSYVLSFRMMVFFYLVTTGWILTSYLCENSIESRLLTTGSRRLFKCTV